MKNIFIRFIWDGNKYQAKKKYNIAKLIKNNVDIGEIPNIVDFKEMEEFSYLVSEYKEGIELEKIESGKLDYQIFYRSLANILNKIHSIDIGNKFRLDWKKRIRRKRTFL